ncbi:alpha/beta hydrolase [Rhodococcoides navarretei]|uniref:Alpha/beta hydrolase family protein n=1 Tax=Rhodococcus navarretei TaxID=3128981 RepID=A0ABU9D3A6_9NOCA
MKAPRLTALALAAGLLLGIPTVASAQPVAPTDQVHRPVGTVESIDKIDDTRWDVFVRSPSMDTVVKIQVIRPSDTSVPRPTLYMLNGAGAGVDGANWLAKTDIVDFFADKNVNVAMPVGGYLSYYTDWERDDPKLGRNKWQTFLTHELPPVLDEALRADGVNAIGGLSMSAGSVLDLAIQAPGLYRGVASYSGCAQTSDPVTRSFIRALVQLRGGGNTDNMWGPDGDPQWVEHDPLVNAEKLRGLELFVSNASGLPGQYEMPGNVRPAGSPPLVDQAVLGGLIEAGANVCAHNLVNRLGELGIPVTTNFPAAGTHSWQYWQDALRASWPTLERALSQL